MGGSLQCQRMHEATIKSIWERMYNMVEGSVQETSFSFPERVKYTDDDGKSKTYYYGSIDFYGYYTVNIGDVYTFRVAGVPTTLRVNRNKDMVVYSFHK
jgi:hypothetical protein